MRLHHLLPLLALLPAPPLAAQRRAPSRPLLRADADTNDPQSYFDLGARQRRDVWKARDAFYWASRLAPDQPIYAYARYHALLYSQSPDWRQNYWSGAKFVLKSKEARLIDSTFGEVMLRDPFAHVSAPCQRVPELDHEERALAGIMWYELGCYDRAVAVLGEALDRDPEQLVLRVIRARAFAHVERFDSTASELGIVLDSLRARDADRLAHVYESKAMLEYVVGMAHLRRGDAAAARAAFGRALTEDLGFAMAHARLGRLARLERRVDDALAEYDLAVGLRPDDGVLRSEYGSALIEARRFADAETQFATAVRLEPHWAKARFNLAQACEAQGKSAEAVDHYQAYVMRAPRAQWADAEEARRRIARLRAAGTP